MVFKFIFQYNSVIFYFGSILSCSQPCSFETQVQHEQWVDGILFPYIFLFINRVVVPGLIIFFFCTFDTHHVNCNRLEAVFVQHHVHELLFMSLPI